jgi:hypothetical protein
MEALNLEELIPLNQNIQTALIYNKHQHRRKLVNRLKTKMQKIRQIII